MQYLHYIEESKSWTCPKSGVWKVICVGGGATACLQSAEAAGYLGFQGSATSFGAYVSADGGVFSSGLSQVNSFGGQSGFDGVNYGSTPMVGYGYVGSNAGYGYAVAGGASLPTYGTGFGYGASGGLASRSNNPLQITFVTDSSGSSNGLTGGYSVSFSPNFGTCGKIKSTIINLADGETIACTIGKGGNIKALVDDNDKFKAILKSMMRQEVTFKITDTTLAKPYISDYMSNGADGVIILQYLGESI